MRSLELYEKLVSTNPDIKRKGASMPYTSLNGHLFSLLTKEGRLALRLPSGERELFMEKYGTDPVIQYGRVMRENFEVPDELLETSRN